MTDTKESFVSMDLASQIRALLADMVLNECFDDDVKVGDSVARYDELDSCISKSFLDEAEKTMKWSREAKRCWKRRAIKFLPAFLPWMTSDSSYLRTSIKVQRAYNVVASSSR
jgi:hypothetical protein